MAAGYSGTPLGQKLGVKAGHSVVLIDAPPNFESELAPLPAEVRIAADRKPGTNVLLAFFTSTAALAGCFSELAADLQPNGGLWIAWPKKSSGLATDLTESQVRETGLRAGLVDNKVCAIDETWSGLRFVHRLKDRR